MARKIRASHHLTARRLQKNKKINVSSTMEFNQFRLRSRANQLDLKLQPTKPFVRKLGQCRPSFAVDAPSASVMSCRRRHRVTNDRNHIKCCMYPLRLISAVVVFGLQHWLCSADEVARSRGLRSHRSYFPASSNPSSSSATLG